MATERIYLVLHWSARILGVLVAGFFFLFFIGEGLGAARGSSPNLLDLLTVGILLGASVAMLLGWVWEKWGGLVTLALGIAHLCELFVRSGWHAAKPGTWALFLLWPAVGLLYVMAAKLHGKLLAGDHAAS